MHAIMIEIKDLVVSTLERFQSKKFIVWAVATVALFTSYVESSEWMAITSLYLMAQGALDWRAPGASNGNDRSSTDS